MEDWKLRLRQSREGKELNKTAFARLVGVSNATVTDWEKAAEEGGIKELSASSLVKIYEVLGVDLYWLLSGKGSPQQTTPPVVIIPSPPEMTEERHLRIVTPEMAVETAAPDMLQWVSLTEAELLTDFRCLADGEQEVLLQTARSLPRIRQPRPRADQS